MGDQDGFLNELYPFLKKEGDPSSTGVSVLLESVRQKADHSLAVKREFFDSHAQQVVVAARVIAEVTIRSGKTVRRAMAGPEVGFRLRSS